MSAVIDLLWNGETFASSSAVTGYSGAGAPLDQLIDPITLDYVRTPLGEWAETADSRSIVLIMLSVELGASPLFPGDGVRIRALIREGDPVTPEMLQTEAMRAGRILQSEGILSDLEAYVRNDRGEPLVDAAGRQVVLMRWRDLSGGVSPVYDRAVAAPIPFLFDTILSASFARDTMLSPQEIIAPLGVTTVIDFTVVNSAGYESSGLFGAMTRMAGGNVDGMVVMMPGNITMDDNHAIALTHEDTSFTATSRFALPAATGRSGGVRGGLLLIYCGTISRWLVIGASS